MTFSCRDGTDLDTGENNFFGEENVGFGGAGVLGVHALGGVPQVLPLRPGQEHHMSWVGQVRSRMSGCSKNLHICIVTEVNFLGRIILLICKLKLAPPNSTKSLIKRQRIMSCSLRYILCSQSLTHMTSTASSFIFSTLTKEVKSALRC